MGAAITTTFYISTTVAMFILSTPRRGMTWPEHLLMKDLKRALIVRIVTSCFGVVIDPVILLLPMIAVMPLQLPPRRKIGVVCVFMTGLS